MNLLQSKDLPLIYIGSLVSWMTAGERENIMLTFIAYCSQVILRTPTSVIGLGEGGSGKTHIQEVALSLIPEQFVHHEKSITEAAMFNRAKDDPYYYDGCIVNYGDMGGRNSQDFIIEAKNLLKELQSDGFINKPLNIPGDEGWNVMDITLYGYPCLTYTTVPGFEFDDQEMSRSIFITPRMDNKEVFNARKQIMELKHGRTYKSYLKCKEEIKLVKFMVMALRERLEEITIINPYTDSVIKFLGQSEYFKRDFDKYNGLLKTITAFHVFNRSTFMLEGEEILFTTINDIKLFKSLLKAYHESVSVNISPKASEILRMLRKRLKGWIQDSRVESLIGITTTEFYELTKGEMNLSKRSVQRYFGELNAAGLLKVIDSKGSANVYELSENEVKSSMDKMEDLTERQQELIRAELGGPALEFIKLDVGLDKLGIEWNDQEVDVPGWDDYDC